MGRRGGRAGGSCWHRAGHSCSPLTHTQVPHRTCRVWWLFFNYRCWCYSGGTGNGQPASVLFSAGPEENVPCATEGSPADTTLAASGSTGAVCHAFQAAGPRCPSAEHHQPRALLCSWGTAKPLQQGQPQALVPWGWATWLKGNQEPQLQTPGPQSDWPPTPDTTDLLLVCQASCSWGSQSCRWDGPQRSESSHSARQWVRCRRGSGAEPSQCRQHRWAPAPLRLEQMTSRCPRAYVKATSSFTALMWPKCWQGESWRAGSTLRWRLRGAEEAWALFSPASWGRRLTDTHSSHWLLCKPESIELGLVFEVHDKITLTQLMFVMWALIALFPAKWQSSVIVQVRHRLEVCIFTNIRCKLLPQTGVWTRWNNTVVCYSKSGVPGFKSAGGILDFN